MKAPEIVGRALIDRVLDEARESARLRKNYNFHEHAGHPCQRLLNAVLPDSYVRPHRHLAADRDETLVILRGRLGLVFFDEAGTVTGKAVIDAQGASLAVNIPAGQFHGAVALAPTVVLEVKAGPFEPLSAAEKADFAPAEGAPGVAEYLARLRRLFDDQ